MTIQSTPDGAPMFTQTWLEDGNGGFYMEVPKARIAVMGDAILTPHIGNVIALRFENGILHIECGMSVMEKKDG